MLKTLEEASVVPISCGIAPETEAEVGRGS
jgi:hypothetical protein